MAGKVGFTNRLETLKSAQNKLISLADQLEARYEPFRQLTEDYGKKIRNNGVSHLPWYVKRWLRCFIGMKDEVMVLISGEVIRRYHEVGVHKNFIHDRGSENAIYRRSSILSLCSVDGIDFEYRMMTEKYGEKSALTRILDIHEPLGDKLNNLSKKLDDLIRIIYDAISTLSPTKCQLDILHPAEKFLITFGENITLNEKGNRFRNCSQIEALSTVIEDPEDIAVTAQVSKPTNKRNRSAFQFEEEENEPHSKMKESQKIPDFHMDVSLDEIKRAAGVSAELLAKPTAADFELREEIEIDEEEEEKQVLEKTLEENAVLFARSGLQGSNIPGLVSKRIIRFKIPDESQLLSSVGSVSTHVTSGQHSTQSDSSLNSEKIVPVVITSHDILLDPKDRSKSSFFLSSSTILDEITTVLWYGLLPQKAEEHRVVGKEERPHYVDLFHPILPVAIQIEGVVYARDELIPLPQSDKPKKYPVTCDNCPAVLNMLQNLQQWILKDSPQSLSFEARLERWRKQDLIMSNVHVIRYAAEKLRTLQKLAQNLVDVDGTGMLLDLDSLSFYLHVDVERISSPEELFQWQRLQEEGTAVLMQSFALFRHLCLFVYQHSFRTPELKLLPFQYFLNVQCKFAALSSLPIHSRANIINNYEEPSWKLSFLDLQDEVSLFQYLNLTYSETVLRWRELIQSSCNFVDVTEESKLSLLSSLFEVNSNSNISSSGWSSLFLGFTIATMSISQRNLLMQDPWTIYFRQLVNSAVHFQRLVLPNALLLPRSGGATLFSWLSILVCFVGIAAGMESRAQSGSQDKCLEIQLPSQCLQLLPEVVPIATNYLLQQCPQIRVLYTESSGKASIDIKRLSIVPIPQM